MCVYIQIASREVVNVKLCVLIGHGDKKGRVTLVEKVQYCVYTTWPKFHLQWQQSRYIWANFGYEKLKFRRIMSD